MRHCFLGNSHVGALRAGWSQVEAAASRTSTSGVSASFFAVAGASTVDFRWDANRLHAATPKAEEQLRATGGRAVIDLSQFDKLWIVGCGVFVGAVVSTYSSYRSDRHRDRGDAHVLVSHRAFRAVAAARLAASSGLRLASAAAARVEQVGLIPQPMPLHSFADRTAWSDTANTPVGASLAELFHRIVDGQTPPNVSVHRQPEATLQTPLTTRIEYGRSGAGLTGQSNFDDEIHMNAAYGVHVLQSCLGVGTGLKADSLDR